MVNKKKKKLPCFWLPTKPYTLIDAINRCAAATGSIHHAAVASSADYNGHHLTLDWNDCRRYYVVQYWWAGRHVVCRSANFAAALAAAKWEWGRQGKGAELVVIPHTPHDVVVCEADADLQPYTDETKAAHYASWTDWRFDRLGDAISWEQHLRYPAMLWLREAQDEDEFNRLIDDADYRTAWWATRKERIAAVGV